MAFNFNVDINSAKATRNSDFYEDMNDLWTDGNEINRTIPSTQIKELQPQDIAAYDNRNESVILSKTNALHQSLYFCDKIVDACFKVSNYIPDLSTDLNASFWLKEASLV